MITKRPVRIALWSVPRSSSTALMYSFAQRNDTQVIDEPLYGYFLGYTGVQRPHRSEVLKNMETDPDKIIQTLVSCDLRGQILFMKHMASHLVGLPWAFLLEFRNIFIVRDPRDGINSFAKNVEEFDMTDLGYELQYQILLYLIEQGEEPLVLDAENLASNPEGTLELLCRKLHIRFHDEMLAWPAGPKEYDGKWAGAWYDAVHNSTQFVEQEALSHEIPEKHKLVLEQASSYYNRMKKYAIS